MLDRVVSRNKDVAWRIIENEAILISAEDSMLHSLDEVGYENMGTLRWLKYR